MIFSNTTYDILKWIAQYLLPASGTLYFALARIWGFPYGEEIVGTISAIDTFIGVLLGISSSNYDKVNDSEDVTKAECSERTDVSDGAIEELAGLVNKQMETVATHETRIAALEKTAKKGATNG